MENKFGLLGRKLGHSWSPQIHSLLCGYEYNLYEAEPTELERFLAETDLAGMNVTIPYKKDVVPYCTELSDAARSIGSVNTMIRREGGWYGDNTDYAGFMAMTDRCGVPVSGKKVLVFGTGGASLAVIAAIRDMGAGSIVNISRNGPDNYENLFRHRDAQILINTTPVGMYPDTGSSVVNLEDFPLCEAVLDVIYNPIRTKLLMDAEARNIPHAGGITMLVAQARRSAEEFAGYPIEECRVSEIVKVLEQQMQNIVLIGMPGCGKTTVGQELARRLHRPFWDTDSLVEEQADMSVSAIFQTEGEAGFRRRETEVLAQVGKESGAIIATGGGCVTQPENYPLLHQNSQIFWIKRNLERLPSTGRPLSQKITAEALYAQRRDFYAEYADYVVESDENLSHTVLKITAITEGKMT